MFKALEFAIYHNANEMYDTLFDNAKREIEEEEHENAISQCPRKLCKLCKVKDIVKMKEMIKK